MCILLADQIFHLIARPMLTFGAKKFTWAGIKITLSLF